jgi:hypothetical protein
MVWKVRFVASTLLDALAPSPVDASANTVLANAGSTDIEGNAVTTPGITQRTQKAQSYLCKWRAME